jgi:chaperonin GroEL
MLYEKSKAKEIIADKDRLKEIVTSTLHNMATIVGATLGPGGRGVLIEREGLPPLVTKDGVTVCKSLGMDKAEANVVVEAAKEICLNTAKEAGDGTTTAIVLADAISRHGIEFMKANPKYNPQKLVYELQSLYDEVILPNLKNDAINIDSEDQLRQVATISANGDVKIAEKVVEAVVAAGDDGTVLIEEGQGNVMRVEPINGYIVTAGLKELGQIGPVFINDKANQQAKMDKGIVFLYDGSMNDLKVPALIQEAIEGTELMGSPILVFAHSFSDVVLDRFAKTTKGGITVVPMKTPMSGLPNSRSMFLLDMAAYTGATVYDPGNLESLEDDDVGFGTFESAKINFYETLIIGNPNADRINDRVRELKSIGDAAFSDMDRMHIRAAIGKLTGGISTIFVGGASELEVREKKHRVEDAVEAVRSAIAEGVVPGGGITHIRLARLLHQLVPIKPAAIILVKALYEPVTLLLANCGEDPEPIIERMVVVSERLSGYNYDFNLNVFDANKHEFVNALDAGIIEPAKVCRVAIGNALSVASLLMTLGGIVVVPRDSGLENQLAMSKQAFKDMMASGGGEQ